MKAEIFILCIGKCKKSEYNPVIEMYLNRINRFIKITQFEIPAMNYKDINQTIKKESEMLIEKSKDMFRILLDSNGKKIDTESFVRILNKIFFTGSKRVCFIIGGPYGVSDYLKSLVDLTISLSCLNLPYLLARTILFEQIYRSLTIIKNVPYQH
ncbi:MAG: 23S rRNA (pseudouridine(1915)-N(3))-methyltransferase RlmH [Candidatus Hydrogenedentota bacterium]